LNIGEFGKKQFNFIDSSVRRKLQQKGRHPLGQLADRAYSTVAMVRGACLASESGGRAAANRNDLKERVEGEEIRVVEWLDSSFAELTIDGHWHSAYVELSAKLTAESATDEYIVRGERTRLVLL